MSNNGQDTCLITFTTSLVNITHTGCLKVGMKKPEPNSLLMFFKLMSWSVTWVYLSLSEDEVNSFFPLYCPVKFSIDPVSALKLDWLQATAGAWIIYRLVPLHWHKRDTLPSMPWLVRAKRELKSTELFLRSSFFFFQMKTFSLWVSTTSRTSKVHSLDLKKGIEDHVKAEEKQLFPTIDFRSRICYLHRFWTEKMAKVH